MCAATLLTLEVHKPFIIFEKEIQERLIIELVMNACRLNRKRLFNGLGCLLDR